MFDKNDYDSSCGKYFIIDDSKYYGDDIDEMYSGFDIELSEMEEDIIENINNEIDSDTPLSCYVDYENKNFDSRRGYFHNFGKITARFIAGTDYFDIVIRLLVRFNSGFYRGVSYQCNFDYDINGEQVSKWESENDIVLLENEYIKEWLDETKQLIENVYAEHSIVEN